MKNGLKKVVTMLLVCALATTFLAGCGDEPAESQASSGTETATGESTSGETTSGDPYAPIEGKDYTFTWIGYQVGPVDDDPIVIEHFEELLDCNIEVINIENTRWDELLNIKLASGEIPDMIQVNSENHLNEYLKQEILAEIPDEAYQTHMPHAYEFNTSERYSDYFDEGVIDGVRYGIAAGYQYFGEYRSALVARGDWMENLGITEYPETLEDFEKLAYAFAKNDPDGNGQDDTYGISSTAMDAVYGAFGSLALWYEGEDSKLEYGPVREGRKEALALLQKWYADGVVDPEFITGENQGGYWAITHAFDQGRIGISGHGSYYHWFNGASDPAYWATNALEISKVNMDAAESLAFLQPPVGPDGECGLPLGDLWSGKYVSFGKQLEEEPDKMGKLMEVLDYICATDADTYLDAFLGLKGTMYTEIDPDKGAIFTEGYEDATQRAAEGGANILVPMSFIEFDELRSVDTEWGRENGFADNGVRTKFRGTVPAYTEYGVEMDKILDEGTLQIITGEKPIDYFDEMVDEWLKAGGQEYIDQVNEAYQEEQAAK